MPRICLLVTLAALLVACAEQPLPQRRLSSDDCLKVVRMDRLKEAIALCDRVVAAFPRDPLPLNERFLLHSLSGDNPAACKDIAKASKLASALPPAQVDPLLRTDLELRRASCRP